jgi:hypothetical protein
MACSTFDVDLRGHDQVEERAGRRSNTKTAPNPCHGRRRPPAGQCHCSASMWPGMQTTVITIESRHAPLDQQHDRDGPNRKRFAADGAGGVCAHVTGKMEGWQKEPLVLGISSAVRVGLPAHTTDTTRRSDKGALPSCTCMRVGSTTTGCLCALIAAWLTQAQGGGGAWRHEPEDASTVAGS